MSKVRISRNPAKLADQCEMAGTEIPNESNWSAAAPTADTMMGHTTTIRDYLQQIEQLKAQLSDVRGLLDTEVKVARKDMGKVDGTTDVLYGPDSQKKKAYGLRPKDTTGGSPSGKPEKVVILTVSDGVKENSIFCDFTSEEDANYEVQWSTTSDFAELTGQRTVTVSEIEIAGLTVGVQYWVRVRAIRAGQYGSWSDPATRVANV